MSRNGSGDSPNNRRSIQDATRNLERAVEELASAATEEVCSMMQRHVSGESRAAEMTANGSLRARPNAPGADANDGQGASTTTTTRTSCVVHVVFTLIGKTERSLACAPGWHGTWASRRGWHAAPH